MLTPSFKGSCMDLYLATRSDAPHLLKIGRSSNAHSRCRQLQIGHCFQISVLAIFGGQGACETSVHRSLQNERVENSEWFTTDLLTAIETIQDASSPQRPRRAKPRDLEARARKQIECGQCLKSTRYPHLNTANPTPA